MTWFAQAGQDRWVADNTFRDQAHGGFFVDVGAHDGITHSNSYALERSFGWRGICVEPNPDVYPTLVANRPLAQCEQVAVTTLTGTVRFNVDHVVPEGAHGIEVPADTLAGILDRCAAPPVIDYLSIDTEGHESGVIAGMDFERWQVHLITAEHNRYMNGPFHKDVIFAMLSERGFQRVVEDVIAPGYGPYEDWWRLERWPA